MNTHNETLTLMDMIEQAKPSGTVMEATQIAIRTYRPMRTILQTLKEMYLENEQDTIRVFGEAIVNQLKKVI